MRLKEFVIINEEIGIECGYHDFLAYHEEEIKRNNELKDCHEKTLAIDATPVLLSQGAGGISNRKTTTDRDFEARAENSVQ
jgi:hypothetical protein